MAWSASVEALRRSPRASSPRLTEALAELSSAKERAPSPRSWTGRPRAHAGRHRCALPAGDLRALLRDVPLSMDRSASVETLRRSPRANSPRLTEVLAELSSAKERAPSPRSWTGRPRAHAGRHRCALPAGDL